LILAAAAAGKYVNLDLSLSGIAGTEFNPDSAVSTGKNRIVSLVLPNGAQSIKAGEAYFAETFRQFTYLKRVDGANIVNIGDWAFINSKALTTANFPAATSIGYYAFQGWYALTTITIKGACTINNQSANRFDDFVMLYDGNGKQAGTYTYAGNAWTKN
jgi:hypothetical protein